MTVAEDNEQHTLDVRTTSNVPQCQKPTPGSPAIYLSLILNIFFKSFIFNIIFWLVYTSHCFNRPIQQAFFYGFTDDQKRQWIKKKIVRFSNQIIPILDNWKLRENN